METIKECYAAIEAIEANPRNVVGGIAALMSGKRVCLTARAQKQIKTIERKIEKLADECEDD